jgi:hypothetical protein
MGHVPFISNRTRQRHQKRFNSFRRLEWVRLFEDYKQRIRTDARACEQLDGVDHDSSRGRGARNFTGLPPGDLH